jgi:CBS domain-containing protein
MRKAEIHDLYLVDRNETIYDCLVKFEDNYVRTLLVTNEKKIVGSVTDGDIRRALIRSRTLSTIVGDIMNTEYLFAMSDADCKEYFNKYWYISLIPVVNSRRELESIFLR